MFRKILIPYVSSELSDKAISQSIELSAVTGSELTLFHVIERIPVPGALGVDAKSTKTGERISLPDRLKEIYQEIRSEMLSELERKKKEHEKSGISINIRIDIGSPADKILELVKSENIDLVVMGSKKKEGISKFIQNLGSVTRKVAENIDCQLLIVR